MTHTTRDPEADHATTLAKVNDNPPDPDETEAEAGEKEDDVTVLARVNNNPSREDDESRRAT